MSLVACRGQASTPEAQAEAKCPDTDPHPIGQSIATRFDVTYDQVMLWFCRGEEFDDILLALQTGRLTGHDVEELLEWREQAGWEQVWSDLGLVPGEDGLETEAP
jgi:hypothetical protein